MNNTRAKPYEQTLRIVDLALADWLARSATRRRAILDRISEGEDDAWKYEVEFIADSSAAANMRTERAK